MCEKLARVGCEHAEKAESHPGRRVSVHSSLAKAL